MVKCLRAYKGSIKIALDLSQTGPHLRKGLKSNAERNGLAILGRHFDAMALKVPFIVMTESGSVFCHFGSYEVNSWPLGNVNYN